MSGIRGNKSELTYLDNRLKERIYGRLAVQKQPMANMAHRLGMSEATLRRRLEKPREFTLCELRKLVAEMGWSKDNTADLLFGQK